MMLGELLLSTSVLSLAFLLWGVLASWWKEECEGAGKAQQQEQGKEQGREQEKEQEQGKEQEQDE